MSKCAGTTACVGGSPRNCANRPWWRRPIYWDRYEEPQDIRDVLFNLFILVVAPFLFAAEFVGGFGGASYLATYDGLRVEALLGTLFMLGWWYLLWRKR